MISPVPAARWWQTATIYQIYPRSFQDSDGDGIGDLRGTVARLDYLRDLGVDALWLSPIFTSPMADFGYDVADYRDVDPIFGSLGDLDALIAAAHDRGLRVLLDLVPNHSSSEHPWFRASRSSRIDRRRDWYIWHDPGSNGGPPNNWTSDFGGSAWEWDAATGQYYLHAFLKEQPDLNWRNPDLRAAMMKVLRFWFARGIDGFRIDVLWHLMKHADFPDNPANPDWTPGVRDRDRVIQHHSTDQPEVHAIAAEMRQVADEAAAVDGRDRVLIGEIYLPYDRLMTYYGNSEHPEVHLPFNFRLIGVRWTARSVAAIVEEYESALPEGAWPNWVLSNHDQPRIAARIGAAQARIAMMLLLTLRGTPTIYYGDELGLAGEAVPPDSVRDPQALREPGAAFNRDEARLPMAWDASPGAGFTTGEPWLPVSTEATTCNVATQESDPGSMLSLTRALLGLRRERPALVSGTVSLLSGGGEALLYERRLGEERMLVALNLSGEPARFDVPDWVRSMQPLLVTGHANVDPGHLAPDQGVIWGTARP
ncbi:alpha-amylase family glycosyl hydrolase [Sphingomonas bacterium]|uniref:alpha-amylase family glycosyl hydrolase n=1 Tax=Sphingomonas bacterium TaxID=1895847 RepID=UPI0015766403|nr:alpha-amylase family glycosyl hydrolase [Sphingomonas bacterium]